MTVDSSKYEILGTLRERVAVSIGDGKNKEKQRIRNKSDQKENKNQIDRDGEREILGQTQKARRKGENVITVTFFAYVLRSKQRHAYLSK
jgi:hypothetical protein